MKGLVRVCRLIVGVVFVFSGFVKMLTPVGTSLIMKEYFTAFHLDFLQPAALAAGVALAVLEFLTGVALLLRLRIRIFAWPALLLISVFTPLTLYLAVFNPIADCGCFGEAIHLSNWQTFFKNLILLPCVIIIFVGRKSVSLFRYPVREWIFVALFAAYAVVILWYVSHKEPLREFTAYRLGREIAAGPPAAGSEAYDTEFIYEKDGRQQTFTLDNLPDSTWTFVDARTSLTNEGEAPSASDADFLIEGPDGSDITESILSARRLLLMTIYHPDKFFRKHTAADINRVKSVAESNGLKFVLVSSAPIDNQELDCGVNRADLKLLMTLNRSNGGATYLDEGTIVRKWARPNALSPKTDFGGGEDPELILLESLNRRRGAYESSLAGFILLCLLKFILFFRKRE